MIKPRKTLENIQKETIEENKNWRLKLDKNDSVFNCNASVISAIKSTKEEDIAQYPNKNGLIKKFSEKFSLNDKNILFTNTINEALRDIFDTYLEQEDLISVFQSYKNFINKYAQKNNNKVINFAIKEELKKESKIIYISTPNNITGTLTRASFIETLLEEYNKSLFVIDCTYINYTFNSTFEDYIDLVKKYNNVILIKSYSKDFALSGLDFTLILANENVIDNVSKISSSYINSITINCISMIINDEKRIQEIKEQNQKAKDLFINVLSEKNFKPYNSQSNFILCDFKQYCDFYWEKLKQNGIATKAFSKNSIFNSCLRITIPTLGGVKFINELLNKKDVLIFSDDILLEFDSANNEFKPLFYKNSIEELSKKYDLVILTKYEIEKIKTFLKENDIEKNFYYIQKINNFNSPDFDSLSKLKENCPNNNIRLISSDIQNIIAANMTNTQTIAVIMPNKDFNYTMNNYKHLGIKNILGDYKNLEDFINQIENFNNDVNNFIIN